MSCGGRSLPQKLSTLSFWPLIVMKTITISAASQLNTIKIVLLFKSFVILVIIENTKLLMA
jgi:hypothetical protein